MFHTAELGGFKYTSDELAMSDLLVTYWTTFAHSGNPNPFSSNSSAPDWPQYRLNYTSQVFASMKFKTPKSEVCCIKIKFSCYTSLYYFFFIFPCSRWWKTTVAILVTFGTPLVTISD